MDRQKKILWVAGIVSIYIAVAIVGFFVVYFIKTTMNAVPENRGGTPIPTIEASNGYTRYDLDNGKISIEYPERYTAKEASYGLGVTATELRSDENQDPDSVADFQMLAIPAYLAKAAGQDFEKYYAMKEQEKAIIESPVDDTKESFTKVRNRTINGAKAVEYSSVPSPNPENYSPEIGVIIQTKDKLILISTGEEYRDQLETMLNSVIVR